ncbi:pentapeptide repeat-containing protein, partial [Staphylococcus capitis]|uniref:pentapeptide repeat-containing protein n=1 Tax=Staphylococcus capitis TaxID=29388 RepID=UPI003D0412ED
GDMPFLHRFRDWTVIRNFRGRAQATMRSQRLGRSSAGAPERWSRKLASRRSRGGSRRSPDNVAPPSPVEPSTPAEAKPKWHDTVTSLAGMVSVVLVAAGLFYTNQANRSQQQLATQQQVADRFSRAIDQLGQEDSAKKTGDKLSVRLGGIYSLQRLMHDSPSDESAVIEVLCAFIRTHAARPPGPPRAVPASPPDVQAAFTVLAHRPDAKDERNGYLNLAGTQLTLPDADLGRAYLESVNLERADLTGAFLNYADFTDANLSHANLTAIQMGHGDFSFTNLRGADLRGAHLSTTNLGLANLTGADLTGADLRDTDLSSAYLTGANLTGVDLTGANLEGAKLTGADLTGANLTGANLSLADLEGAKRDEKSLLPQGMTWPSPSATR